MPKILRPPMVRLLFICMLALLMRAALMSAWVRHPGIADPNHYYNMGVRLVEGHGFTIDYIWQYNAPPASIVHPEEHWMPLTAALAAIPMAWNGISVPSALLLFMVMGSALPAVSYWGARQLHLAPNPALWAAAACAVMPELVLNSLRTDTTIPFSLLVCLSICLVVYASKTTVRPTRRWLVFIVAGALAGLSYLTRNDGILLLPMMFGYWLILRLLWRSLPDALTILSGGRRLAAALTVVYTVTAILVAVPWLIRNLNEIGSLGSPETTDMFFFTHHNDHYAFGRAFTLETMLAAQTPQEIIGKRLFEMAAAVKMMVTSLGVVLPVAVAGGVLLLLLTRRDPVSRARLRATAPTLLLLAGGFVAYTVFIPYKAQAGSFKKFFLALLPLLIPIGAYAIERMVAGSIARTRLWLMTLVLLAAFAVDTVRLDQQQTSRYLASMERVAAVARTMVDRNRDGQIILMAQDPFMLRYVGYSSIMYPWEDVDTILQIAQRYGVDYLLFPPDRPQLDPIANEEETDPRFVEEVRVRGTDFSIWSYTP